MKIPICHFCLRSGILCAMCQEKLRKGLITELDLKIMRFLVDMAEKVSELDKITYNRSIEANNLVIIVLGRGDLAKIARIKGKIAKKLSKLLNKNVKIVEETSDVKQMVSNLIAPARLLGVNYVYVPGDVDYLKIRVSRSDKRKISQELEALKTVVEKLTGFKVLFSFE